MGISGSHDVGTHIQPIQRLQVFDLSPGTDKFYVWNTNVQHGDFGEGGTSQRALDNKRIVKAMNVAFFDTFLKDNAGARKQCLDQGYLSTLATREIPTIDFYKK
jgi:hypothetical protein